MRTGPTKKHDFEKGNRKAKAHKSDYRDDLAKGPGKDPEGLWQCVLTRGYNIVFKPNRKVERAMRKQDLIASFRQWVRKRIFDIDGYRFSFAYDLRAFATANQLSAKQAPTIFDEISEIAQERLRMVNQRMCHSQLQTKPAWDETRNELVEEVTLSSDIFEFFTLHRDDPLKGDDC